MSTEIDGKPLVATIVLNWNGAPDTIRCLASLRESTYMNLMPIVVDNGSTDDSVAQLRTWRQNIEWRHPASELGTIGDYEWSLEHGLRPKAQDTAAIRPFCLIESPENLGFAAGCNVGIRLALMLNAEFVWLLNNDSEVDRRCLEQQVALLSRESSLDCLVPVILTDEPHRIVWNCGGRLLPFGLRRYFYAGAHLQSIPSSGWRAVTFVTGCSLLLRRSTLLTAGLLCEDFFFGEEDIEYSIRLRRLRKRAACNFDSKVVHRLSSTIAGQALASRLLGRVYVHYLNRLVHFRRYYPYPLWRLWRAVYLMVIGRVVRKRHAPSRQAIRNLIASLRSESAQLSKVSRETFLRAVREDFSDISGIG